MRKAKRRAVLPNFSTAEEEAEFWLTHGPATPKAKSRTPAPGTPKDRPITIRLDSQSKQQLKELAATYGVGPSTFARRIIDAALHRLGQSEQKALTIEKALELIQTLMPKDLEERVRHFSESNPAVLDDMMKNQDAAEALLMEITSFLLRVGGLLKSSGFTLEEPARPPGDETS
ncbi:MAG: hypothetical protein HY671_12645 [Chloroflexi bacterium]|nr:hypothetical protein [Chloroflexota bacterium]